jgi:ABC-type iron transport system FetAB ATPase subunit
MRAGTLSLENIQAPPLGPLGLELQGGTCTILRGPSGAGKTRLLRCIVDLDPHQGRVRLDGRLREHFAPWQWRRRVGLLSSESRWWADRVGEHFAPGAQLPFESLGLVPEILSQTVATLSSGERQRLALLRLLANEPQVLLLDEPTAHLDAANTERIETLLSRYRAQRGTTVLWVSHDPGQAARVASRVLTIADGILLDAPGSNGPAETPPPVDASTGGEHR